MRKRKDKNIIRDIIFAVGVVIVVTIVGVGVFDISNAQDVFGRAIRIIVGDTEIVIDEDEGIFGGLVHNVQEDFSEGISVDGTEVIDGSGRWVSSILDVTTSGSEGGVFSQWGSSSLAGCLILGDRDHAGLSYVYTSNGVTYSTGGASGGFTIPSWCQ